MTAENLLLRLRAETLQTNLHTTLDHMQKLSEQPKRLADLKAAILETKSELAKARGRIGRAWASPEGFDINKLDEDCRRLQKKVDSAAKQLEELEQLFFLKKNHWIAEDLNNRLVSQMNLIVPEVSGIERTISGGRAISLGLWDRFRMTALAPSRDLFELCIDLLGGIAIRDMRFDSLIWMVADELVQSYNPKKSGFPARTIPARLDRVPRRVEQMSLTLARIVRLRFPEWTIWALPLTAHEFWHIDVRATLRLELIGFLREVLPAATFLSEGDLPPRFETCIADAFATYIMGPAYACATIGLLLDPIHTGGDVADDVRAETILSMLAILDDRCSSLDKPFGRIREELGAAWSAAKRQQSGVTDPATEPAIEGDREVATLISEKLAEMLSQQGYTSLTPSAWQQVLALQAIMASQVDNEDAWPPASLPTFTELRQVLNAAWLARIDPRRDPGIKLDERALKLAVWLHADTGRKQSHRMGGGRVIPLSGRMA